jgi:general secretion pathway protein J
MSHKESRRLTQPWRKRAVSVKGFTLLELLVALALLVILSSALYGTLFSLMRVRETAAEKMDERRELSVTLDQLRREISASFYSAQNNRSHFVVEDRDFFGKPASTLDFTVISSPRSDSLRASDQAEVIYKTAEKEQKLVLSRQEKDMFVTAAPLAYPQMRKLEGFLVECFDGGNWIRTWDTALNGRLPNAVRVTLSVREGDKTVNFSTIARPRIGS